MRYITSLCAGFRGDPGGGEVGSNSFRWSGSAFCVLMQLPSAEVYTGGVKGLGGGGAGKEGRGCRFKGVGGVTQGVCTLHVCHTAVPVIMCSFWSEEVCKVVFACPDISGG